MSPRVPGAALLLLLAFGPSGCSNSVGTPAPAAGSGSGGPLTVVRGSFLSTILLTGELEAAQGEVITVPKVPSWQVSIQWLETDGNLVRKGQKVVELDNTPFSSDLREKEADALRAAHELAQEAAEKTAELAEKKFRTERQRLEEERARIQASVPESLLGLREFQDRQLALTRAKVLWEKAEEELRAARKGAAADLANRRLALEKTHREIQIAREAVGAMTLTAPRDGVLVLAEHPWEGRKLQVGDTVWVGFPLATIPDLGSLQVAASLFDVDDGKVAVGRKAFAVLDAYPDLSFPSEIAEVATVAQESGFQSLRRAFRVVARLNRLDPRRMRPGFSVKLIVVRERRPDALLAPRVAFDFSETRPHGVTENGRRIPVRLGPCNGRVCVVEEGLREGMRLAAAVPTVNGRG